MDSITICEVLRTCMMYLSVQKFPPGLDFNLLVKLSSTREGRDQNSYGTIQTCGIFLALDSFE